MWLDVHTHLEMLEKSPEDILSAAQAEGVEGMITIGCHPDDFQKVEALAEKFSPQIVATVGVHPHEAKFYSEKIEMEMRRLAALPFVVGLGEMGLDYYYSHSDHEAQRDVFHKQMAIAAELNLPVEIHTRDAEEDTIAELKKWKGRVTGLLHCFSGTQKLADEALDLGFYISLSGVITFRNAESLRETVKTLPLDRIFVETDAPYLAPVPMRGKKNEPAYVVHTAKKVCELKGVSEAELSRQLKLNARQLFKKWQI